jgi:hypothetical protein
MPGARLRGFRLGDRAELLVQHLLTGLAYTTPVPRQEDIGIDFLCSLITGGSDDLLKAGPFFAVQAKSSADAVRYEKPHELEWIQNQENPLLLCVADREAGAMDVYSTWNLICGVSNGWKGEKQPTCIALCPGKSGDWPGVRDEPDGSQKILLGKPIVRVTHDLVFDEIRTKQIVAVMVQWIVLDRLNIVNRSAGLHWVIAPKTYETNKGFAPELGVIFYWHPQNLTRCSANLARSAIAMWNVLHHSGISLSTDVTKPPWPALQPVLRDLCRWCRDNVPLYAPFLRDLDD